MIYSGQGGSDALTYTTPVIGGSDQFHLIYTPGASGDAGTMTGANLVSNLALLPLSFQNIGNGTLAVATADNTRSDFLEVSGTAASDLFTIAANGNVQVTDATTIVQRTPTFVTTGLSLLELHGLAGIDNFVVNAATGLPFAVIVDGGGDQDTVTAFTPNTAVTTSFQAGGHTQTLGTGINLTTEGVGGGDVDGADRRQRHAGRNERGQWGRRRLQLYATGVGAGSLQVIASGAALPTYPTLSYGNFTGNLTVTGGSATQKDTLGLTATTGNDTINAVQTDATHLSFTLNAFTQLFAFSNLLDAAIAALAGNDVIRISVADALETTTPAGRAAVRRGRGRPQRQRSADRQRRRFGGFGAVAAVGR